MLAARQCRHNAQDYSERRSLRAELRQLQKEERKRQERAVTEVIRGAQVSARLPAVACVRQCVCEKSTKALPSRQFSEHLA